MTPSSPRCRGILKRDSTSESSKHVSFSPDEECEVFVADVYDRTPCAVCTKLSYSDVLELKQLEISLRMAQRGRENSPYLSNVPLVLLPLLPSQDSSPASSSCPSSGTSSPIRTPSLSDSMNTPPPTPPRNRPAFKFLPLLPPSPDPAPPSPSPAPELSKNEPAIVGNVNPTLMTPPQESVALDPVPAPTLEAVPSPNLVPPSPFSLGPPTPTTPTTSSMRFSPLFGFTPTQRSSCDFVVAPISAPFLPSPTRPRDQSDSPVLSS